METKAQWVATIATVAALAGAITACAGKPDQDHHQTPPSTNVTTSTGGASPTAHITVRVLGDAVEPAPHKERIARGSHVELTIQVDHPVEIHIHGYDLESEASPGKNNQIDFIADIPGVFEVETHPTHNQLVQLEIE